MPTIEKVRLRNFKRFSDIAIGFHKGVNLLIGDNESGKTTVLVALDLVLSGSRTKVETMGLNNIFNMNAIAEFLGGSRRIDLLPVLLVEVHFSEMHNPELNGTNNSEGRMADGIALHCEIDDEYSGEVQSILASGSQDFPFEYYKIYFDTFAAASYSSHRKALRHLYIDNSQANGDYATRQYIGDIYNAYVDKSTDHRIRSEYRNTKNKFASENLNSINTKTGSYQFAIRSDSKSNLEHDLTLMEHNIPIEYKGRGRQCFAKTDFAMRKSPGQIDAVLLEEPENHLSHVNTRRLVEKIASNTDRQLFVATHNNLIASRLNLKNLIILDTQSQAHMRLRDLSDDTANFFLKAPDHNVLEFVLSKKVILVEGDAEYILFDQFFNDIAGKSADSESVNIISVDGLSFKRYLDIAVALKIKVAVVRDNDGDPTKTCQENYANYIREHIEIFYDNDPLRSTFEICLYQDNKDLCTELFGKGRRKRTVEEYMLAEKSEAALRLLAEKCIAVPDYIKRAIKWISA